MYTPIKILSRNYQEIGKAILGVTPTFALRSVISWNTLSLEIVSAYRTLSLYDHSIRCRLKGPHLFSR